MSTQTVTQSFPIDRDVAVATTPEYGPVPAIYIPRRFAVRRSGRPARVVKPARK
jgi:hypothetical protein